MDEDGNDSGLDEVAEADPQSGWDDEYLTEAAEEEGILPQDDSVTGFVPETSRQSAVKDEPQSQEGVEEGEVFVLKTVWSDDEEKKPKGGRLSAHTEQRISSQKSRRSSVYQPRPCTEDTNPNKTFRFRAMDTNEKFIMLKLKRTPPKHDYFGYLFSAESARPPHYYNGYILPSVKQPHHRQHVNIFASSTPGCKVKLSREAPHGMLPLSTLKIRWKSSLRTTVYTPRDLCAYLSRFGEIEAIYPMSQNSALVTFSDLESAHVVASCPTLGLPWSKLIATWHEPRFHNFGVLAKYRHMEDILPESVDKN